MISNIEQAPSVGKTVAIVGGTPLIFQDFIYTVLHDIWGYQWATEKFVANLVAIAIIIAAAVMHSKQREKERVQSIQDNQPGPSGSASNESSSLRNSSTTLGPITGASGKSKV